MTDSRPDSSADEFETIQPVSVDLGAAQQQTAEDRRDSSQLLPVLVLGGLMLVLLVVDRRNDQHSEYTAAPGRRPPEYPAVRACHALPARTEAQRLASAPGGFRRVGAMLFDEITGSLADV